MNSCEATGRLQLFSLLHLRCWGGDAGADHLCPLGKAGWGVAATGKGREERPACCGGGRRAWAAGYN